MPFCCHQPPAQRPLAPAALGRSAAGGQAQPHSEGCHLDPCARLRAVTFLIFSDLIINELNLDIFRLLFPFLSLLCPLHGFSVLVSLAAVFRRGSRKHGCRAKNEGKGPSAVGGQGSLRPPDGQPAPRVISLTPSHLPLWTFWQQDGGSREPAEVHRGSQGRAPREGRHSDVRPLASVTGGCWCWSTGKRLPRDGGGHI